MSSEIRNEARLHSLMKRKLHDKQQNEISRLERGHAKEIKIKEETHDDKLQYIKENHHSQTENVSKQNRQEILEMNANKEKRIREMQDQITKQHESSEQKLDFLKSHNEEKRADERNKHSHLTERNHEQINLEREKDKFNTKLNNDRYIAEKTREKDRIINTKQSEIAEVKNRFSRDYDKTSQQLGQRLELLNKKQENEVKNLKKSHKEERLYTIEKGTTDVQNLKKSYNKEFTETEQVNNQQIRDKQAEFEKRFKNMSEQEHQKLGNLQNRSEFQKNLVRKDFSEFQTHYSEKAVDPFYKMQQLDPKVYEREDDFIVEIPVAAHEKDFYILAGSGRTLRLTFNRDFDNEYVDQDGSVIKSKKFESAVKTIPVSSPIDRNGITKSYKDGAVRFIIQKA